MDSWVLAVFRNRSLEIINLQSSPRKLEGGIYIDFEDRTVVLPPAIWPPLGEEF